MQGLVFYRATVSLHRVTGENVALLIVCSKKTNDRNLYDGDERRDIFYNELKRFYKKSSNLISFPQIKERVLKKPGENQMFASIAVSPRPERVIT